MITSAQNERVKYVRSLARRRVRQREGRFVVEGTRLLDELERAGIRPALAFYTGAWAESPAGQRLADEVNAFEREILKRAIQQCRTTRELSKALGVSQPTVVRKMKKYNDCFIVKDLIG